jgi:hypothetical protein
MEVSMKAQFDQAQEMTNLWLQTVTKMMSAGVMMDPTQAPPDSARRLRDISLTAMSEQLDKYMRSPQFLAMVKQSLDTQIAFRKQLNQFFTDALHSVQSVARQDADALSLSVRHMETRVLDRIETLCERLDQLRQRLDLLEPPNTRPQDSNGHSQREAKAADAPSMQPGLE